jgi:hypothetical protein
MDNCNQLFDYILKYFNILYYEINIQKEKDNP